MFGDEVDRISIFDPLTGVLEKQVKNVSIFPATHFVTSKEKLQEAIKRIQEELEKQLNDNIEETFFSDKLIITKDFIVDTTKGAFVAVKFSDIKWVYTHRLKYYGIVSISNNIIMILNDGKTQFQCLDTKGKLSDDFEKAFDKICDKLSNNVLKGYTQENIAEFREYKKSLKNNHI